MNNQAENLNNNEEAKDRQFEARLENDWRFEADPIFQRNLQQRLSGQLAQSQQKSSWWNRLTNFDRFRLAASGLAVAALAIFFVTYIALSATLPSDSASPTAVVSNLVSEYYDAQSDTTIKPQEATARLGFAPRLPASPPEGYRVASATLPETFPLNNNRPVSERNLQIKFNPADQKKAIEAEVNGQRLELYQFRWPFETTSNNSGSDRPPVRERFNVSGSRRFIPQSVQGVSGYLVEGGGWFAGFGNFPLPPSGAFERGGPPPQQPPRNRPSAQPRPPVSEERPSLVYASFSVDTQRGGEIRAAFVNASPTLPSQTKTLLWQKGEILFALVSNNDLPLPDLLRFAESVK